MNEQKHELYTVTQESPHWFAPLHTWDSTIKPSSDSDVDPIWTNTVQLSSDFDDLSDVPNDEELTNTEAEALDEVVSNAKRLESR
jgi:hypothetical protein